MIDLSEYIDVPVLVIVYILVELIKRLVLKTDRQRNLIPLISVVIGAAISIFIFCVWPDITTNTNVINAFASGSISGSAATGTNQLYKKVYRFFNTEDEEDNECDCECDC